jgi:geranylgeranyl pyrophosphate synthase
LNDAGLLHAADAPPSSVSPLAVVADGGRLRLLPDESWSVVRAAIEALVDLPETVTPPLRDALAAILAAPGSLWRAQLAWAVGRAEGLEESRALALATSVEAFHTASLVFDDLPAMDDATTRRGQPCVHRTHGEAAAILAALALVNVGHERLAEALDDAPRDVRMRARRLAARCLGVAGILDGQARDVYDAKGDRGSADALRRAAGKSVPLLELALAMPSVVAGGPAERSEALGALAGNLGLAYQLLDDLEDAGTAAEGRNATASRLGRAGTCLATRAELARGAAHVAALSAELPALEEPLTRLLGRLHDWLDRVA